MSFPGEVKMRTLIVEDIASYREMIRDSLKTLFPSMVIHEASGGNEAIQTVRNGVNPVLFWGEYCILSWFFLNLGLWVKVPWKANIIT
jgi:hypothetical protein